jgi:hypothetical protein
MVSMVLQGNIYSSGGVGDNDNRDDEISVGHDNVYANNTKMTILF